jgi:Tol biopolymer transport system component
MRLLRIGLTLAAPFVLVASLAAQSLEGQLQRAVQKELATGDHKAATSEYKRIAEKGAGSNRAIAAQALLRMAEAYQKLGDAEAGRVYQRIVDRFADQTAVAATARDRLGAFRAASARVTRLTRVWSGAAAERVGAFARVSPDGRSLAFVRGSGLVVREIASGVEKVILSVPAPSTSAGLAGVGYPVWSPDGQRLAFLFQSDGAIEVRRIKRDGSDMRTVMRTERRLTFPLRLHDWLSDGRILADAQEPPVKGDRELFWIGTDGTRRTIKRLGPAGPVTARVSPDGRRIAFSCAAPAECAGIRLISSDGSGETALSSHPGDDYPVGWRQDSGAVLVVSRRSQTLGLWEIPVSNQTPTSDARMVERDLCGCGELVAGTANQAELEAFGTTRDGTLFFRTYPFASDIYTATLDPATGRATSPPTRLKVSRNGYNVWPQWSADGKQLLYYWSSPSQREFTLASLDGTEKRLAVRHTSGGFCWFDNTVMFRRAVTGGIEFRRLDLETGRESVLFQDTGGNMTCSADGTIIGYPHTENRRQVFRIRSLATGATADVPMQQFQGGRAALSPDGKQFAYFALSEGIRLINGRGVINGTLVAPSIALRVAPADGGPARELIRAVGPEEFKTGVALAWSADGKYLYYPKRGNAESDYELFRIPAAGGPAERLGLSGLDMRDLSASPDGTRIAFALGPQNRPEIWATSTTAR